MKSLNEFLVCFTHPMYATLDEAREVMQVFYWLGARGMRVESCRVCGKWHLHRQKLSREQHRMIMFIFSAAAIVMAAVGASVFHSLLWFCLWEILSMLIVTAGALFQIAKL